uniref:Aminotransferase class I/classII domain-containing protein n=1 Tax=Leptocylindrus danicus TaxID=163516 RepID=A0A7S2KCD5_9STRA|mmetsp:Transcript_2123/g.3118  ORF Transcript_2123/g.3118 Transcript_2123/m.3118 type:complete len:449 (+) Transcript_2123:959-2305(+)|eukprot:CAMPEP_0116005868 /NCGR_PEP_ID=MMETSP0321-20121206/1406_1 /TAXON_ID=163516 /ORGANISM="Leptocylindrus danicus var. danicus, Strain B650" /LENGTH=448 /DNA_ID=CAMNT_0003474347 /DNA_START=1059 /DNA_END=2405 /DNA_ORIENTATION=-
MAPFNVSKLAIMALVALNAMASSDAYVNPSNKPASVDSASTSTDIKRTFINRDIKTPDGVPEEGIKEAMELMASGRMYRYNVPSADQSTVSLCEQEVVDYTGHKYCVALNSCGSAIMLMMKTAGLEPGDKVMSNAFTFGAVPSAIEHAGGKAVYVESNYDHVMCPDDLEVKLAAHPDCKFCLISHMRGKVGDMDRIADICEKNGVTLLEDCAHSLGVYWQGKHTGHKGRASAISSQSYKMINSGEGGFFLTDDAEMAAKCAVYAGAYEGLAAKHLTVPGPEVFADLPTQIPNYSLRMSGIAAAVIRPQMKTLEARIAKYNGRYYTLCEKLEARLGDLISIPKLTPGVTQMVHDSIQFNVSPEVTDEQIQVFLDECKAHGLPVELFGHKSNARNFVNWGFAPAEDPLPRTAAMLSRACDCRMPLMWDDEDFDDMADVICESLEAAVNFN